MGEIRSRSFVSAQMVADLAGVSRSAVSRTFTDGASVSEATRQKVLSAATTLGYHVNHLARGLIQDRSNIVCVVVSDLMTPFRARMLEILTRRLQGIDKVAMVVNTGGDLGAVSGALQQALRFRADATIVLSGTPAASLVETCVASGQRVVLINRDDHLKGSENLAVDNESAAGEALFLLHRAGCQRLAVVSSEAETPSLVARHSAFTSAARKLGLDPALVRVGPTTYHSGVEAARRLFSRPNAPDGVFCVTDLLALGFMDAARHEFGLDIPRDLCVIGFDDIEQASWESYRLTTFSQPAIEMVDHIAALLESEDTTPAQRRVFAAAPVWRKTVRPNAL